eukprot:TRINITY_DN8033_c0_g1_i1.p1 TRINITY_DN8033_c0_g1~~TRINITY_DN8033_c0_g1_i1.p1  ORF type:complete len:1092 (+),score=366.09 TRINITY_DN8033_c0_g1_i1:259-3534(+)
MLQQRGSRWRSVRVVALAAMLLLTTSPTATGSGDRMGLLDDTKCNIEAIENANSLQLFSILDELLNTTHFRIFRVDLKEPCHRDKAVEPKCAAPAEAFDPFGAPAAPGPEAPKMCDVSAEKLDRSLSRREEESAMARAGEAPCCDPDLPEFWLDMCSQMLPSGESTEHINLVRNPEMNTGYNGTSVWQRMYSYTGVDNTDLSNNCYEERVLYRLLSGMHTSINVHISNSFYPPSRKRGNTEYLSNPQRFMDQYASKPEYIQNLHFSFVVVLRALVKAAPILRRVAIDTGDAEEDERTKVLLHRLLDTPILTSCRPVFTAFDEGLMFQEKDKPDLKTRFKWVFKNVSAELDCVTCQKCKLHGKVFVLGLGTALKTLLVPESLLLSQPMAHEEVVALVNTAGKLSASINYVSKLQNEYMRLDHERKKVDDAKKAAEEKAQQQKKDSMRLNPEPQATQPVPQVHVPWEVMDHGVGQVRKHMGDHTEHDEVLHRILKKDVGLLALARHYEGEDFKKHASRYVAEANECPGAGPPQYDYDAIVVGGGLAGLSAALTLLDAGLRVCLLEKESFVGGNSALASSGINGVNLDLHIAQDNDTVDEYKRDVFASSGLDELTPLASALVEHSGAAVQFLQERVHLTLDKVVQMGGHSHPRTYRPSRGMAGAEIVMAINAETEKYSKSKQYTIFKKTRATSIILDDKGSVGGVEVEHVKDKTTRKIRAPYMILASGGFAIGRQESSLLSEVRPDLNKFATTNGRWCTGDGHRMAGAVGATTTGMKDIQVHPTGFIDPRHPEANTKTLCAELLRGMGSIMLLRNGSRFVNELGTRQHVSGTMVDADPEKLEFTLLVHEKAAKLADKHVPLYEGKKLLQRVDSLDELSAHLGVPKETIVAELNQYNEHAAAGKDPFGKTHFNNAPIDLDGYFYVGKVTPVLHYTMGGLTIDEGAHVMNAQNQRIPGLYAAGEVTGGLHGKNRLGGNALTECVVFGRASAESIIEDRAQRGVSGGTVPKDNNAEPAKPAGLRKITPDELSRHNTAEDCWVAIHGKVYDLTEFVDEHPGGPESVSKLAGIDGTAEFAAFHGENMLGEFDAIGEFAS